MDYLDRYDNLVKLLNEDITIDGKKYKLSEEMEKFFVNGNKSAGIRVRKIMQMIRKESFNIRKDVSNYAKKI
jgi:hypothetical protein